MKKVFKDFLNKYYKESLVKKKDKGQKVKWDTWKAITNGSYLSKLLTFLGMF